jgi:hypothetical protein
VRFGPGVATRDGSGLCLFTKRLEQGVPVSTGSRAWPHIALTSVRLSALIDGVDWVRRETERRQRVKVPYDERSSKPHRPRVTR